VTPAQTRSSGIAVASGSDGATGHLEEFRADPVGLMQRVRDECGDVGAFDLAHRRVALLTGGAGRHRCVGAEFATMQIKAIFSVLLREYEFEVAQPADSYRNDHSKMVVQLARPAKVRYRRRTRGS
jgi:Cytochrome P450